MIFVDPPHLEENWSLMANLPEPTVEATPEMGTDEANRRYIDVTISRDGSGKKTYRGTGGTQGEVTADVVKQIITDPQSLEWQPARSKP